MFTVYILHSDELGKFYAGHASDLEKRLERHGKDRSKFTGRAQDWKLVWHVEVESKSEAMKLELSIKKRGIGRFLADRKIVLDL